MVPAIAATANLVLYGALTSKTYPMMIMQIQVATSSSRSFIFFSFDRRYICLKIITQPQNGT